MNQTEKILHSIQRELSLSRSKISEDMGVSLQAISNWCNRDNLPKKAKAFFSEVYNVDLKYLESGSGPILLSESDEDELTAQERDRYICHLEGENEFLRDLVKTLTRFNESMQNNKTQ